MKYANLGASGLKVSRLCLGAMTFGNADEKSFMHQVGTDEATAHAILSRAADAGVNLIDVADVYGQDGLSERVIGDWLTASKRRDDLVLATKFRFRMRPGPNGAGASRAWIVRAAEDSLRRLKTDRIDLYQIHMQDLETPEEETLRALDDLVRAGKVLYLGCSNYAAYRLVDSLWLSRSLGLEKFVALQAQYSLIERGLEREHVPACAKFGLGILPWSPLAAGFLTGKYKKDAAPPAAVRPAAQLAHPRRGGRDRERAGRDLGAGVAGVAAGEAAGHVGDLRRAHGRAGRRQPARGRRRAAAGGGEAARRGERVRARLSVRLHAAHPRRLVVDRFATLARSSA